LLRSSDHNGLDDYGNNFTPTKFNVTFWKLTSNFPLLNLHQKSSGFWEISFFNLLPFSLSERTRVRNMNSTTNSKSMFERSGWEWSLQLPLGGEMTLTALWCIVHKLNNQLGKVIKVNYINNQYTINIPSMYNFQLKLTFIGTGFSWI